MKKIVLSIFGIFVLAACSGDVYQEADKQNERNFDNLQNPSGNSGGNTVYTIDPGITPGANVPGFVFTTDYQSPYSVTGGNLIMYHLINNTHFDITITPHIGFFCYGSWVDVYWNGGAGVSTMPGLFTDGVSPKQYGNTIAIDPVKLPPFTSITHGPSTGRFPLNGASWGSSFTDSFNTINDVAAMKEIGKIYFIKYDIPGVASGVLKQKFGNDNMTLPMVPGNWNYITTPPPPTIQDLTFNPALAMVYQDTALVETRAVWRYV